MNKNIKIEYDYQYFNGHPLRDKPRKPSYVTVSTDDLKLPSLGFDKEEDAELAVAIAKALIAHGKDYWSELHYSLKYVFRTLNFTDSGWTK